MTGEEVLQAVCDYVQAVSAVPDGSILVGYAGNIRPGAAFITVTMVSDVAVGMPGIVQGVVTDDDGSYFVEQSSSLRDARLGISGFGYESLEWLEQVELRWREKRAGSPAQILRAAGVSVYRTTPIQSRPVVTATEYEPRWAFDVLVYFDRTSAVVTANEVDAAASVVLDATVTDSTGTILNLLAQVDE